MGAGAQRRSMTAGGPGAPPTQLRTLKDSAERLGELIAKAADRKGKVPQELWRAIAEAAVHVAAAAEMLAGDSADDPAE